MVKAQGLGPARAPHDAVAEPALAKQLPRKKKKKKRFWKSKAREAGGRPGGDPSAALRPPRAPEAFSQNWRALQEVLKQKSPAPEKPLALSQRDSKKQPQMARQDRKAEREEAGTEKAGGEAAVRSLPPASLPGKARGAEHREKAAKRRTNDVSPKRGGLTHQKRKANEAPAALAPAPPTERDIWFDDVDPADIEAAMGPEAAQIARKQRGERESSTALVKEQAFSGLTKALAMDCEMVGVGPTGEESLAARVSIVNQYGKCVYDKYIKPTQPVTDYRTAVSGVRPEHLQRGEAFAVVQKEVAEMLRGRILVGHSLHNDLKVLFLDHPRKKVRDTQKYKPFKRQVQIQDAQAAMRLYITVKKEWERAVQDRRPPAATTPDHGRDDA
ncbi:RNA exonuclease 4 isoform X2 [Myotis myotis]|uniref:RNA exonuclease 4 isoform X2 n=1 Tax=Myotis myotis TaxID=51298 RepID=UPI00174BBD16|nr:RNA exonuclease 4 isoform X2 [Myotis myotis]